MIRESKPAINEVQMQNTMLEYAKTILPKVSFSKNLFSKELKKCIQWVEKDQVDELYNWCNKNFADTYSDILTEAFSNTAA